MTDPQVRSVTQKSEIITSWLTEKKAEDLLVIRHPDENSPAEVTIIATVSSLRHGQGLADYILGRCREEKFEFLRMEGFAVGLWILLDLNDIVIHIFQKETREQYNLDNLWPTAAILFDTRKKNMASNN